MASLICRLFGVRATGEEHEYPTTCVYMMFSKLEWFLIQTNSREIVSDEFLGIVREEIQNFKVLMKEMLDVHCKVGLYTLRHHLLDHFVEYLDQFESLELLNSSESRRYSFHIKQAYWLTLQSLAVHCGKL